MSNKRQLKKHVRYVCGDLAAELLVARSLYPGFDNDKVAEIIGKIAELQVSTIANASFSFDKARHDYQDAAAYNKERQAYNRKAYSKLNETFGNGIAEIVKMMNQAMPQSLRDDAKKA